MTSIFTHRDSVGTKYEKLKLQNVVSAQLRLFHCSRVVSVAEMGIAGALGTAISSIPSPGLCCLRRGNYSSHLQPGEQEDVTPTASGNGINRQPYGQTRRIADFLPLLRKYNNGCGSSGPLMRRWTLLHTIPVRTNRPINIQNWTMQVLRGCHDVHPCMPTEVLSMGWHVAAFGSILQGAISPKGL